MPLMIMIMMTIMVMMIIIQDDDNCLSFRMMEYAGKSDEEIASAFIVGTCQFVPTSFSIASDHMHDLIMTQKPAPKEYSILCGSLAEFYIRPLNACITDS